MLPLLDIQFEWCFADAKLSLLKYGSFVSVAESESQKCKRASECVLVVLVSVVRVSLAVY